VIRLRAVPLAAALLCAGASGLLAQELEPRRWTHLPVGTNAAGLGWVYTDGDLDFDPVLEITEAEVELHTLLASYTRYFGFLGETARVDVQLPYQTGRWEGLLSGAPTTVHRDGPADPRIRLSWSFLGAPALERAEYMDYLQAREDRTVAGVGLAVRVPLGEYMDDKLINLGENRWSFQTQVGAVHHTGPWSFELTGSAVFYTTNDDFYGGNRLEQDPLYALQAHVVRSLDGGFWVSGGAAYGLGGEAGLNGTGKDDDRRNLLYGASAGVTVAGSQSFRVGYLRQESRSDVGLDAHNVLLSWTIVF
jgi:hypothetical protein